ncbi:MAG TPA: thiol reductant ABC exporter subunit CydC [Trinickia sp.]|uniref:thiol reductant ABC exporter subunit CydC n=1 Tax=Trinickia sp. TaxID=2571163 RepID=UPI002CB1C9C3|nr:thiol reductant ABC exporter subunit CydC [Trinickia sp.]HTI18565.1 thiol reductant ABC exporter subunit CydC [Trinickia sp.]
MDSSRGFPDSPQTTASQARADLIRLFMLFRPYWRWMALGAGVSLVTLLANVALMAIAGWFIASMALAGIAQTVFDYFTPSAAIRACAILRTAGRYVERLVTHEATLRLLAQLRVWFYTGIEPLAPARLSALRGADLLGRIQADIDSLNHVYLRVFVPVAVAAVGSLVILAAAAVFSASAALVLLVFLLLAGVALPAFLLRRADAPSRAGVALRAQMRETIVDSLHGLGELRVYGAQESYANRVDQLSDRLVAVQSTVSRLNGFSQGALMVSASLAMWCTLWVTIPRISDGTLPRADLAMLALLALASFEAVLPLPLAMQMLGESLAAARRIFALVDAQPAVADPHRSVRLPSHGDVSLRDVCMRYRDEGPLALDHVSLDLPAGGRIALVGESGAGKSSIVSVLLRFWDYQAGSIQLGGVELRDLAGEDVRARIAVVAQDTYLFNATIRENLLLARPDADQAMLESACRNAQLHDFIASLPQGYDTELGEAGVGLSGGQARRLAIARALLLDAPVLILDEPTEGLDTVTEQALLQAVMRLMEGRSVLIVTHRLSALTDLVDEVLVMQGGRIVQRARTPALPTAGGGASGEPQQTSTT